MSGLFDPMDCNNGFLFIIPSCLLPRSLFFPFNGEVNKRDAGGVVLCVLYLQTQSVDDLLCTPMCKGDSETYLVKQIFLSVVAA